MENNDVIRIVNASENNLASVTLDIPRNKFVVVTGVSGSGKSSLVFDVLYREAEFRYFGSFSAYARQFLGKMKRPEVERIDGLSPAVAVNQSSAVNNPRSTVGTITGIYDHLRLLFARTGQVDLKWTGPGDLGMTGQVDLTWAGRGDYRTTGQVDLSWAGPGDYGTTGPVDYGTTGPVDYGTTDPGDNESTPGPDDAEAQNHRRQAGGFTINRSLFSFNSPEGACPHCKGLGVEDRLDPGLLIGDPAKSIRQRAMNITTPNGYIMYSQVTLEVLDQVCRSEGFNIDIPWQDLTPANRDVIFYGSDKIEIPFGKHPLESRMKWSGITAKPREMGVYKGVIPVMEEILKRDRNKNILRFVRTAQCSECGGKRLNHNALLVKVGGLDIAEWTALPLTEMADRLASESILSKDQTASEIVKSISSLVFEMDRLGLGHLSAGRESGSLTAGESRRLKLATQLGSGLSGMIYVFDEPSAGLHDSETLALIGVLKQLRDLGNTVIVVEHDEEFIRHADHIIDIGPGAGIHGGKVLLNAPVSELMNLSDETIGISKTLSYYFGRERVEHPGFTRPGKAELRISGACCHNLKHIDVSFLLQGINVVTGVSGAGKASLVHKTLGSYMRRLLEGSHEEPGKFESISGIESFQRITEVDQSPIGRTPRSNPATYTGLFDHIRDLFASLPESAAKGFGKSRFSFNTAGGRCEDCQGAGYRQTGMHFMGNVETICETCNGRRFDNETLEVKWNGKNVFDILEMPVSEALLFFAGEEKILRYLRTLDDLGLGYLTLGQRSSTLSGGEAQRVKLSAELLRYPSTLSLKTKNRPSSIVNEIVNRKSSIVNEIVNRKSSIVNEIVNRKSSIVNEIVNRPSSIVNELVNPQSTLYILDEPTTGLHNDDVKKLLLCLNGLANQGHTLVCIEHHPALLKSADRIIELGPGSGKNGGNLVFSGSPGEYFRYKPEIRFNERPPDDLDVRDGRDDRVGMSPGNSLILQGVTTHNLKHIDVYIPHNRLTVLTGVSGSGKSSLAFDTIHAEAGNRFLCNFSAYARSKIGMKDKPVFDEISGLRPSFAVEQSGLRANPRSTVGTYTGIYDLYRLLFSRAGIQMKPDSPPNVEPEPYIVHRTSYIKTRPLSTLFSFNSIQGACPSCDGLGTITRTDPEKLITNPERSLLRGAMDGSKTGKFYGDPYGQFTATLLAVGTKHGIDFLQPWNEIPAEGKNLALLGCGDEIYEVDWEYKRDKRSGTHHFRGSWPGLLQLVNEEYVRKHADHRGEGMMNVMSVFDCDTCRGRRLNATALGWYVCGKNIDDISSLSITASMDFFKRNRKSLDPLVGASLTDQILSRLDTLRILGLDYLSVSREVASLSHGEARRLQLAALTGSGLTGMIYVLDEPTAGLHPRDTGKLMEHMRALVNTGNTVVVVEHDREVILAADHVIDMGPGAGRLGGEIVAAGSPMEIISSERSVTGSYLKKSEAVPTVPQRKLKPGISIRNAYVHNLKNFDVELPSGGMICVTGVSGSGKSSLVFDLIHDSWIWRKATGCSEIRGFENFSDLVTVERKEEFSSPLSVVATYSGAFDLVRTLFGSTEDARSRGFGKNHFSFLNRQSSCPECEGTGMTRISMDFMPDIYRECEVCLGKRFRPEILEVQYQGTNISGILDMSISEASVFFRGQRNLHTILNQLEEAGLGYLSLGQPLDTLSGGEAQRLNLCRELLRHRPAVFNSSSVHTTPDPQSPIPNPQPLTPNPQSPTPNPQSLTPDPQPLTPDPQPLTPDPQPLTPNPQTLYLFDEPSTGLHFRDIDKLLELFKGLVESGNTLVVIEHDMQIISRADYIIELGPVGGEEGGYLLKSGLPGMPVS